MRRIRVPKRLVAATGSGLLVAGLLAFMPAAEAVAPATPACPSTVLTRTGSQSTAVNQANSNGTWNLTGAQWVENAPKPIMYPIRSDSWGKGCVVGGEIFGNVPKTWTRDQWYNAEDGGERYGGEGLRHTISSASGSYLVVKDTYVEDYEDAFDPDAGAYTSKVWLDHVHAKYIRDDCIENEPPNEEPADMVIKNSLFDGCFTGIAERPGADGAVQNGSGDSTFEMYDSLMYIQPQPLGPNYCSSSKVSQGRCRTTGTSNVWEGAHGIWKWSPQAASTVKIHDTIFRLDMAGYSSCSSFVWPDGDYEDVTVVWTGSGSYSSAGGCNNTVPSGVTVTTDVNVWNTAKTAWLNQSTPTTNNPPSVNAGTDASVTLPNSASLDGTVTDDGNPSGSTVTQTWTKVSGPGTVTFGNASNVDTTASFSAAGTYILQLTASDTNKTASDQVTITVNPASPPSGVAPTVSAGPDRTVNTESGVLVAGSASDADSDLASIQWDVVSGNPGDVDFSDKTVAEPNVIFWVPGTYVLRITGTDSAGRSATDEATFNVIATAPPECEEPPTGGNVAVVGTSKAADQGTTGGDDVTINMPTGVQPGDTVIFLATHNKGSRADFNVPTGLTAVAAENDDGSSVSSRVYKHVVTSGSPSSFHFTTSGTETVYQTAVTAVGYRNVDTVTQINAVGEANDDTTHPVTGTTTASAWNLVLGGVRKTGTSTPFTYTLDSGVTSRETNSIYTADQTAGVVGQVFADTNGSVAAGSKNYAMTTNHSTSNATTHLIQLVPKA